jgi:hypothetical protein
VAAWAGKGRIARLPKADPPVTGGEYSPRKLGSTALTRGLTNGYPHRETGSMTGVSFPSIGTGTAR